LSCHKCYHQGMDQVEEIKQKVDIVELVGKYLPLKKAGRNYKGNCPFHGEKTPSFMVNSELQIFKCFGCSEGGDVFTFLQKIEGMNFYESLKTLADQVGVKLISYRMNNEEEKYDRLVKINTLAADYYHYLLTKHKMGEKALKYLKSRQITQDSIERFKIGYAPDGWDYLTKFLNVKKKFDLLDLTSVGLVAKNYDSFRNRIMFPINSARGQVLGFAGRVLPGGDEKTGKYVNTSETEIYHKSEMLYGLDITRQEIKSSNLAIVVEGEIDAIASWQAGVKNVVAIKGSALTEKQVLLLKRFADTLVLALDQDFAGDTAARRGIEIAEKNGLLIKVANWSEGKDPGELAINHPQSWKKAVKEAVPVYDFYLNSAVMRFGLDVIGKQKIIKEILPIFAKISDEIIKAHYILVLAKTLGVGEEDVRRQLAKMPTENLKQKTEKNDLPEKEDTLDAYVVELALKGEKIQEINLGWFDSTFWKKVVETLRNNPNVSELPAELKTQTQELLLKEGDFKEADWLKANYRLEERFVRANLGQEQDTKRIKELTSRLNDLTRGR